MLIRVLKNTAALNESSKVYIPTYRELRTNCRSQSESLLGVGQDGLRTMAYSAQNPDGGDYPMLVFCIGKNMRHTLLEVRIWDCADYIDDSYEKIWPVQVSVGRHGHVYENSQFSLRDSYKIFDKIIQEIYDRGAYSPEYSYDFSEQKINKIAPKIATKYDLERVPGY